jgi:hypothetical protein
MFPIDKVFQNEGTMNFPGKASKGHVILNRSCNCLASLDFVSYRNGKIPICLPKEPSKVGKL